MDLRKLGQDWCFATAEVTASFEDLFKRIVNLEQQVANQALATKNVAEMNTARQIDDALKKQAALYQGVSLSSQTGNMTGSLYAPLRSDTKPLLEMAAFVRRVAAVPTEIAGAWHTLRDLAEEAQEILKRST
jgi:hypothetical protein